MRSAPHATIGRIVVPSLLLVAVAFSLVLAGEDPVAAYIRSLSPLRGDNRIFLDDQLLRYDVDLNNDGKREVLLSMARDRNGKRGNVWSVFSSTPAGFVLVGAVTANAAGYYLGPIDEIGAFGIVTFWPGGGGTGVYMAYVFDGSNVVERQLGVIDRNPQTLELKGTGIKIAARYAVFVSDPIRDQVEQLRRELAYIGPDSSRLVGEATTITSHELSARYGINVEPKTYREALRKQLAETAATPEAGSSVGPSERQRPAPSPTALPRSDSPSVLQTIPPDKPTARAFNIKLWVSVGGAVAIVALTLFLRRGKNKH